MQSQKDSHPGLNKFVVTLLLESAGQGLDEIHQLVGLRVLGTGVKGADL